MKLLCITTDSPLPKNPSFFLEVGENYEAIDQQVFNNEICYVLKEDKIGALYPAYFFEIVK